MAPYKLFHVQKKTKTYKKRFLFTLYYVIILFKRSESMGEKMRCTYCGKENTNENGVCEYCHKTYNILLAKELNEASFEDSERLLELRSNLRKAVQAFDYRAIDENSAEILGIIPNDFCSNYYQSYVSRIYYDDQYIIDFLTDLDFTYANFEDKEEVLRHLILTSPLNYNVYISSYLKKFTNDEEYRKKMFVYFTNETKRKETEQGIVKENRDCFILYSEKDKELAYDILELLEDEQIACFIGPRDLGFNHKTKYDDIATGIKQSTVFVIVGSKNFINSEECVKQAQFAQRMNKKLIYFRIDDASNEFSYTFKHVDVIDAMIDQYGKFEQLLLQVQIDIATEDAIIKSLISEREKVRKRDEQSDEDYRHEQEDRIKKMEQVLANTAASEENVAADQEYIESLRECLKKISEGDFAEAKNKLVDCERNYPNNICTTILNLSFLLRRINQPSANIEFILEQIKALNTDIVTNHEHMSEDEKAVYMLLNNQDVYSLLIHVFFTIGDQERLDFIETLIDFEQIESDQMFQLMLDYLLGEGRFRIAYHIISKMNHKNLDVTLDKVLMRFKDGDIKIDLVETLIKADAYSIKDSTPIEKYLEKTSDKVQTKVSVVLLASKKQILINTSCLIRNILFGCNDTKYVDPIFDLMSNDNISRDDFTLIIDHVLNQRSKTELISLKIMTSLFEKHLSYDIDQKNFNDFLRKPFFNELTKVQMTEILCKFPVTRRSYDSIMNYYLCFNQSKITERVQILEILFKHVKDIPITALERYVITSNYDGDDKPLIVQMLLDLNMNPLYFSTILSNYLVKAKDTENVQKRIVSQLVNRKLTLGTEEFISYLKTQTLDSNVIRILVENGQNVKPECIEEYLLRLSDSFPFSEVIFENLLIDKIKVSGQSLANYALYGTGEKKFDYFIRLSKNTPTPIKEIIVSLPYAQDFISCNLVEAYILKSKDNLPLATKMINSLTEANISPNQDIKVGAKTIKFKKYLNDTKSFTTDQISQMIKIAGI